jgi:hypothetical protein
MVYNKTFLLNDAQIGYGLLSWIYHITRLDIQQGVKPHELLGGYSFIQFLHYWDFTITGWWFQPL